MEKEIDEIFDRIYDNVYKTCKERLDDVKKQSHKVLLLVLVFLIILNLIVLFHPLYKDAINVVFVISIAVFFGFWIGARSIYIKEYKFCVIDGIVKGYNKKFYFDPKFGVPKAEYLRSDFDTSFDEYYSEDRIFGKLENGENFQMAEVVTHEVSKKRDSDGNVEETKRLTFRGLYGKVIMNKNIVSEIHIKSNSAFRKYSKDRLEMESSQFEKYYDCLSLDKVSTMRVFTAELIEKYNELAQMYNNAIEVKIKNDEIFFRYKTACLFEPPLLSAGLNKEYLKNYFRVIYYPIEIMKATIENIYSVYE